MNKTGNNQSFFRKFIASTVILLLLYTTCGYIIVYQLLISLNRQLINLAIEENEVAFKTILLSFKKSDIQNKIIEFNWERKNEFRFNGDVYDIVESHETADSIYYMCIHDKMEKHLETGFIKHFEGEEEKKNSNALPNSLLKIKLPDFFYNNDNLYPGSYLQQKFLICFTERYVSRVQKVPSPPPKSLS